MESYDYNWIDDDICLCGNADKCPNKENCLRNGAKKKPGIYTISLFYQENKECEYYIPMRTVTKEKEVLERSTYDNA